jgi:hypothetical protein
MTTPQPSAIDDAAAALVHTLEAGATAVVPNKLSCPALLMWINQHAAVAQLRNAAALAILCM